MHISKEYKHTTKNATQTTPKSLILQVIKPKMVTLCFMGSFQQEESNGTRQAANLCSLWHPCSCAKLGKVVGRFGPTNDFYCSAVLFEVLKLHHNIIKDAGAFKLPHQCHHAMETTLVGCNGSVCDEIV